MVCLVIAAALVVNGGTAASVEAAVRAKAEGRDVILRAPRTYLGEDVAGTLACLADGETPLAAKRRLERRLVDAGVDYETGVAEAGRNPPPFRRAARIVVAGSRPAGAGLAVEELPGDWTCVVTNRLAENGDGRVRTVFGRAYRCTFDLPFAVTDAVSRTEAEMVGRDLTWVPDLLDGADELIPLGVTSDRSGCPSGVLPQPDLTADVVVAGGGCAGSAAAIAAAREGRRVILCEFLHHLGGMGTSGGIGQYWQGRVCGFTAECDGRVRALGAVVQAVGKREAWRRMCRESGVVVLFGAKVTDAARVGGRIVSVGVMTDYGRLVLRARAFVDATGNADLVAAAGGETAFLDDGPLCVQGAGLAPRPLGVGFVNSDFDYVDTTEPSDVSRFLARGRLGAPDVWDVAQLVGARDRRRIVGDVTVTGEDIVRGRRFADVVCRTRSNFDSHGPVFGDLSLLSGGAKRRFYDGAIPYRALLPRGLANVIAPGLGMSANREAMPILRMQPDVQNAGYAAGLAAAFSLGTASGSFRDVDVAALQRRLVEKGVLSPDVLSWRDAPIRDEEVSAAVATLGDGYRGIAVVLSARDRALPLLRAAYAAQAAVGSDRALVYAHVLGVLGCSDGAPTLVRALDSDQGHPTIDGLWREGLHAYARRFEYRDSLVIALGRTRSARAEPVLRREAAGLDGASDYLHFRAVVNALENLGMSGELRAVARKPGVLGHVESGAAARRPLSGYSPKRHGVTDAEAGAMRELDVAAAIFRTTGDAELLRPWTDDGRGVFARYARNVISGQHEKRR